MYVKIYICTCICVSYSLNSFHSMWCKQTLFVCVQYMSVWFFFLLPLEGGFNVHNIYIDKIWFIDKESMVYFSIIKISLSHNRTSISYGLRNFAIIKPITFFSFINRPSKLYIKHASNVEKWTTWLPLCSGSIVLAC